MTQARRALLAAFAASTLTAANLEAVVPPRTPVADKVFRHPDLYIPTQLQSLGQVAAGSAARVASDMAALGVGEDSAFYDARQGRLASLVLSVPLVPGTGTGNSLKWVSLGVDPTDEAAVRETAARAVLRYLQEHQGVLRVDTSELAPPRVAVFEQGTIIQLYAQRVLSGIKVRDASVSAIVNHGNLVLLGLQNWSDAVPAAAAPQVGADVARGVLAQHVQPFVIEGFPKGEHLEYIPMVSGDGYQLRLAWVIPATVQGDLGRWEGLVDAVTGELIAFTDRNEYVARKAVGGVYPVSNDQRPPDGLEQAGWPMPFLQVATPAGTMFANSAGAIGCYTGTLSTALRGRYTKIQDLCGTANETSAAGDLDLGFGPTPADTDCVVPAGHSAGDTKSARSGFYELSRLNEQARGHLPGNAWLSTSLPATMNIPSACNAFWDGGGVNFFKSSAQCRNTGEIAGIFDHEWGHGMDNNGVNPNIAGPGEAIADIHAMMRLNTSCVGRGFDRFSVCGGYGDQCIGTAATGCTGVRDLDFAQHRCNRPHSITWALSGFTSAQCNNTGPAPACPTGGGTPCNRETHCEGMIAASTAWDLYARDLQAPPFALDASTALELATRLAFLGSQALTDWYACSVGGGCGATNGYMLWLAADDDDGNINNGTPHMTAIRAAFERHEIHCATPAPVNSGCAGGPAGAPVVTPVVQDQGVRLSWTAVAGASSYNVYRTEGVNGPGFGKVKIGNTAATSFVDIDLQNGRTYFFSVLPVGANPACFGRMSAPVTVVPAPGANLAVQPSVTYSIAGGDGDAFLDNCETATVNFVAENSGTGTLTNVRLVGVTFLTHPSSVLQTTLPLPMAATLADCATATASIAFVLQGAAANESTQIRLDVTADQLGGQLRSQVITIGGTELDSQFVSSRTYSYETNLSGWTVASGTFTRQSPGANGTGFHLHSSALLDNQCDRARSPLLRLRANSTLSLFNRYVTENPVPTPYDRANVGVVALDSGDRTTIVPSGGRLYELAVGTAAGACVTSGEAGWAGSQTAFAVSTWNSAALNPAGAFTNKRVQLEVAYGTDGGVAEDGFRFDEVTVTNFDELVPDTFPNTCLAQNVAPAALAVDTAGNGVFEPNETVVMAPSWRNTGTQALALTGAATNFNGPAGPTYTIPDGAAGYGTLAVGQSASCTSTANCYSLTVASTTRPITHWDATVLETVNPTATTKTWTLHIGSSFTDVPLASPFYRFIETILHKNVTGGCTGTAYCPAASTTREQMAVFVLVAKDPIASPPAACVAGQEVFSDVPASSPFCQWIEELVRRGVVAGCTAGNPPAYCPTASVTREQMAVFVLRTLDPTLDPAACSSPQQFPDVPPTSPFCRWIEELARRGVVTGCGGGNYCPTADVSREQMSVFLAVTFGLALYGL